MPRTSAVDGEITRVVQATGVAWDSMVRAFEAAGGATSSHTDLAAAVHPLMVGSGVDNPGWWGQGATVAYEKQIGRRATGQSSAGDFQVAASRTLDAATPGPAGHGRPGAAPSRTEPPSRSRWRRRIRRG
ncbi:hypothetical protein PQI66_02930 [Corynebacterium sp. USCH3]|uniref:hypothetical protein n=1 Tax=Corynebacterium sp. USCH3 TaxID=3024840 RepID=UPI0030B3CEEA